MERSHRWPRLAHAYIYYPRSSRGGLLAKGKQHTTLKRKKEARPGRYRSGQSISFVFDFDFLQQSQLKPLMLLRKKLEGVA